jgi:DNA-binding SARP family transcriptional activator/tetratricopeptide (TPR) repeat protein
MIEFRTLGTLGLRAPADGRELRSVLSQPKRVALLAYLAVATPRGDHRRDTLLGIFWPELPEERARAALSQALYVLRRALGEGVISANGDDAVRLEPAALWCDAVAFEACIEHDAATALELYGGDLLKGFFLDDCPEFEHWVERERERLRERALAAARALAATEDGAANLAGAAHWARRAVALSPYDESALHHLIALLARAGDRGGAVHEYEAFARRLRDDLALEPSAELRARIESARAGGAVETAGVHPAVGRPASPAPDRAGPGQEEPAVVGVGGNTLTPGSEVSYMPAGSGNTRRPGSPAAGVALAVLLAIGVAGYAASGLRRGGVAQPPDMTRVLVADFRPVPDDPALQPLARLAADWMAQRLAQTGLVTVIPAGQELHWIPQQEPQPSAPSGSPARALAEQSRAGTLVSGSLFVQGDSLLLQARITNAATGEVLRAVGPVAAPVTDAAGAAEALAQQVIGALASLLDTRLAAWAGTASQPPNLQAYRVYAEALDRFFDSPVRAQQEAADLFRQAAALDTTFTAPLLWAIFAYQNAHQWPRADSLVEKLERSRDRLAPWDRAVLDMHRAHLRGDKVRAYEAARGVAELARGSEWQYLVAYHAVRLNRPHEALETLVRMDPQRGWIPNWTSYWMMRATARHLLGDHEQELADVRRGQSLHPHQPIPALFELRTLVALGLIQKALERGDELLASAQPEIRPYEVFLVLTSELRAHGHAAASRAVAERAVTSIPRPEAGPQNGGARFDLAYLLFLAGHLDEAGEIVAQLAETAPLFPQNFGLLGVIAATRGDRETARWASARLSEMDQPYLFGRHTQWRAAIAAHLDDLDGAVTLLRQAFSQGLEVSIFLHTFVPLEPLRAYPSFQTLMRLKG